MNAVFVDSSVWIDHFRGLVTPPVRVLHGLLRPLQSTSRAPETAVVVVGDLVLLEVLRGIADARQHAETKRALLAFTQVTLGGTACALAAADHYRRLRHLGLTVRKSVDCLIATWCIAHHVPLLHSDRDFAPFAAHCGLKLMSTAEDDAVGGA